MQPTVAVTEPPGAEGRPGARRKLARDTLWVAVEVIATRGSMMLALLIAARWLGPAQFGGLVAVQGTIVLLSSAVALGIRIAATTEFSRTTGDAASRLLTVTTVTTTAGAMLMACVTLALAAPIATHVLASADLAPLLRVGAVLLVVDCAVALQLGILTGCRALRPAAIGSAFAGAAMVALVAVGTQQGGPTGALWGLVAGGCAGFLLRLPATKQGLLALGITRAQPPRLADWRALGRVSLPTLTLNLLWTPTTWAGTMVLVRAPGGFAELGFLGAANQWFAALMFLPNVLGLATLPTLSAALADTDRTQLHATAKTAWRSSLALIIPLAVLVAVASPWIMRLYGAGYGDAWSALALLALAAIPATAIAVGTNVLMVLGHWPSLLRAQGGWAATYLIVAWLGVAMGFGAVALAGAMLAGNIVRLLLTNRGMRRAAPLH
jgi:O-antigen/teichoic acid export membrane protein